MNNNNNNINDDKSKKNIFEIGDLVTRNPFFPSPVPGYYNDLGIVINIHCIPAGLQPRTISSRYYSVDVYWTKRKSIELESANCLELLR